MTAPAKSKRVGVIGAGQLARMMVDPAARLDIDLRVFAQAQDDSAAQLAPYVVGDYTKISELLDFAHDRDVITFEHELVPPEVLVQLEEELRTQGKELYPRARSFQYSQDKLFMRESLSKFGIPAPRWWKFKIGQPIEFGFPIIVKAPRGGYDGRGVWSILDKDELTTLISRSEMKEVLVEEKVNLQSEISVMIARSRNGEIKTWQVTSTIQRDGICTQTITPALDISIVQKILAEKLTTQIASEIDLVGVMAVEMFVANNKILVNELALRPHNSGHWTIEGSQTSQFEQHLRAICGLPLGDTRLQAKWVVMGNLLGGENAQGFSNLEKSLTNKEVALHNYGKAIRKGRKVGHVTAISEDLARARQQVANAVDSFSHVD